MMAVPAASWQLRFTNVEQKCGYLFTSGLLSDCTFTVGSETNQAVVSAHKLILAMASPVFESLLYGELLELNELKISDIQPEAFRALLKYIYTGNTHIHSLEMAWGLLYGAKKYNLPNLLDKCSNYIGSVLAPRNVCRAYELAHSYGVKTIMNKCIQIISTNTKEVLNDSSFEEVAINTVITVCSLDHLNVDSELDLFHAVAKYAEAEQKRRKQICPPEIGPSSQKLSELKLHPPTAEDKVLQVVEISAQTGPAVELDSARLGNPSTEVISSGTTVDKDNLKEGIVPEGERPTIRTALENIRFLSLTAKEFASVPARSGLLTLDESFAVLMNIASENSSEPMPTGFSECRERRKRPSNLVEGGLFGFVSSPSSSVAATNLTTPAEIVRGLLSHELETLEHAARAARDYTCAVKDPKQLVAAGGIPPLLAALHHRSTGVQCDAASAIANIASFYGCADALVKVGAVPVLVSLLGRGGAVAELAARALGNMADKGYRRTLIVEGGQQLEMDYPYKGSHPDCLRCKFNHSQVRAELRSCMLHENMEDDNIKLMLYTYGPLAIALDASPLRGYVKGIITDCNHHQIDHGVLLIGYGEENGIPYWLIKNSWGADWGEEGFAKVQRTDKCLSIGEYVASVLIK